jgi:phenylalanyl-tRNA synthetase beta chain
VKVSLNTIRQFIDFELPPVDELVMRINQQLGQVEEVIDLTAKYKDIVIVKVMACEKHPNADRLSVCKVDDGGAVKDVERDEHGYVQVVCGAPNAREGIFAAWLPPKSIVPASFDDMEPFVLETREIRGIKSNGMMAAADELALGGDHGGIIEINPEEWKPSDEEIKPGASFAKAYGLDDCIIDIENKMFTHRPDLFGQIGIARELSAILKGVPNKDDDVADTRFVNPEWYWSQPSFAVGDGEMKLTVTNDAPQKVPRFMAASLDKVVIKPSPLWLQIELVRLGSKPINNIVDATNYIMLLTAQPTHAYDYDKLRGAALGVRMAREGETTTLLNGKTYQLTTDDIVIVDGEGAVGLGGIMGGGNSEVSAETSRVVLEVATFDMYTIRKSSMRHGLFTDAVTRFNKGQSPLQNNRVMAWLIDYLTKFHGAVQAGPVVDLPDHSDELDEVSLSGEIALSTSFVNARLGLDLEPWQIGGLLRRANFASYPADDNPDTLLVTAPFWRTDIELPEDLLEEVGRLYGFDGLPRELPRRSIAPVADAPRRILKRRIRDVFRRSGANEVLTYSFVHERIVKAAGQDLTRAYTLSNALSPDLQYYRLSVLPSLLDKVHMNIKAGFDEFALFEIGKSHSKRLGMDDTGLPVERESVDLVFARKHAGEGSPYYRARYLSEVLLAQLGIDAVYKPIAAPREDDAWAPFELSRSAVIEDREGNYLGIVGELSRAARVHFKLSDYTAAISLSIDDIERSWTMSSSYYQPLSRYPSISRDISLRVTGATTYRDVYHAVWHAAAEHAVEVTTTVKPLTIYQESEVSTHKTMTFRLTCVSAARTLQESDVATLLDAVADAAAQAVGAERE